jgi:HD-GYP domain-containing protein (c-di-GMP phosphodiesterase class II)
MKSASAATYRADWSGKNLTARPWSTDMNVSLKEKDFLSTKSVRRVSHMIAERSDIRDLEAIKEIEAHSLSQLASQKSDEQIKAIDPIFSVISYYEHTGCAEAAIKLAEVLLHYAIDRKNLHIERRARGILGLCHSSMLNFDISFAHFEAAHNLAIIINEPLYIIASLTNISLSLHDSGFNIQARDVALRASTQPATSTISKLAQLINATNAIRISHTIDDCDSAQYFYDVATTRASSVLHLAGLVLSSNYEFNKIEYQLYLGNILEADRLLGGAIRRLADCRNLRVESSLFVAQAKVRLAKQATSEIDDSLRQAELLLRKTTSMPVQREEILNTLVELHRFRSTECSVALHYARELREYIVGRIHRQFVLNLRKDAVKNIELSQLREPDYLFPDWTAELCANASTFSKKPNSNNVSPTHRIRQYISAFTKGDNEIVFHSEEYRKAEDWAVAAEALSNSSGRHCFYVGRVAREIGTRLGFAANRCSILELACRLHDIGKIGIAHSYTGRQKGGFFDRSTLLRDHALIGERLLQGSEDPILSLAAIIAKTHHECWNGTGYPSALRYGEIPLEGRICAVADVVVSLVFSPDMNDCWSLEDVCRQLSCMSGVQLDPHLTSVMTTILREVGPSSFFGEFVANNEFSNNRMIVSRDNLLNTVSLN